MKKDGRLMASFSEIIDQIKIAILPQDWLIDLLFFVVRLMAWEGAAWGIIILIHRGQG